MTHANGVPARADQLHLWVALRWMASVRSTQGVSFISMVSIAGLTLGVAALITVLSVMNGFDAELRARILGIVPHVLLTPVEGESSQALLDWVERQPRVRAAAPHAEASGMVIAGARVLPVGVFGIDPAREAELSPLPDTLLMGRLQQLTPGEGVFIGAPLAARIGVFPGDRVTLLLPSLRGGSVRPEVLSLEVRGLFRVGAEPDHLVLFTHYGTLVGAANGTRAVAREEVRIALDDLYDAPRLRRDWQQAAPGEIAAARDWTERYGQLFQAVGMEKTMMGLLLGLIVAIAVFNIVASLAMVVDEKRAAIATLRTLGASRADVVRIFVTQGVLIGASGVIVGTALGCLLAVTIGDLMSMLEGWFGFRLLAGTYFDRLPSVLLASDVVVICGSALTVAVLGAVYPALRAGRVEPARALHGG